MRGRSYKFLLAALAAGPLSGDYLLERNLNHEREVLGLTIYPELKGAPPILALTTVALGGFRGLISNLLWIRASELQDQDKFFEMVQLSDWITKLEPHFSQVWVNQAWNMSYNISVKFKDAADRWRWVQRGIELLRDEGLAYNPNDILIYRELAWHFQHKLGQNLDDAHMYYKQQWANAMSKVFGNSLPDWNKLLHPQTMEDKDRATLMREKYKMNPEFAKHVDDEYGPLEWRLPEASSIYWAMKGLEEAQRNPQKVNPDDFMMLRRAIYQSMQLAFIRGRLISNQADRQFEFGPNLEIIGKVNQSYLQQMEDDPKERDQIQIGHRNFLRDAVYFLYTYNRRAEAQQWFKYLGEQYPDKLLIGTDTNSMPGHISLDDYAMAQIQDEVGSTSPDRTRAVLEGLEFTAYKSLALGEQDRYVGYDGMAQRVWNRYTSQITGSEVRVPMPPLSNIRHDVLQRMLTKGLSPGLAAQLRTALGLPAQGLGESTTNALPSVPETNAPPVETSTNSGAVAPEK